MAHLGTPWQLSPARTRARARARTRTSATRPGVGSAGYGTHRECRLAAAGCCCRGPSAVCCSRSRVSTLSALTPTLSSPENVLRRLRLQPVVLASGSSRAAALFSFSSCRGEKATLKRSYRSDKASHDSPMAALRVQGCHRSRRTGCGSGGTSAPRVYSSTKRTAPSARKSKGRSWRKPKAVSAMHTIYIYRLLIHTLHTRGEVHHVSCGTLGQILGGSRAAGGGGGGRDGRRAWTPACTSRTTKPAQHRTVFLFERERRRWRVSRAPPPPVVGRKKGCPYVTCADRSDGEIQYGAPCCTFGVTRARLA